jgi:integrase
MSLYRRPGSPHWWCRFQLDGREVRLSARTSDRRAAEEFETIARSRAYRQIRLGERAAYAWKDAARRWLTETRKRSKAKDETILAWISKELGDVTLPDITRDVIDELRALKAEGTSEATADRYMALLRAILKKAADDWSVLERAPKVPMYRPEQSEPRWLSAAEWKALRKELPPHLKDAAEFAVHTGLRMRAMLSLKWDQVDRDCAHVWIAGADMKGRRAHGLALSPGAVAVLRRLKRADGHVFLYEGQPIGDCNTAAFQKAVQRAKVAPLRWHDLRHTWASWAVQSGLSLYEVMELGGWKSLAMVQRYAHLSRGHLAEAAGRMRVPGTRTGTAKRKAVSEARK